MRNCKPQTIKCHTWPEPRGHVCSLQFTFEPQEGLPAVSDLRQGFLPHTKKKKKKKLYSLAFKGMN